MAAYVDAVRVYPNAWGVFRDGSCHLVADTVEELHGFAERLGLQRSWFQVKRKAKRVVSIPHYDLTARMRRRAVRLGAKEVGAVDLVRIGHALRDALNAAALALDEQPSCQVELFPGGL